MKTTEEMIAVMQAYADGKQIECKYKHEDTWIIITDPIWDWVMYDYRIKEEPKYRPFKNAEEVMDIVKEKGNVIKWDGDYFTILFISDKGIMIGGERLTRDYVQCL